MTVVLVATTLAAALPLAGLTLVGDAAADQPDYLVDINTDQSEGKTLEGVPFNYTLKVTNLGQQPDIYTFQLGGPGYGLDEVTAYITLPSGVAGKLSLDPGDSAEVILTVTIDAPKGSYEVALAAISQGATSVWDAAVTTTTVVPDGSQEYGVKMGVEPDTQVVEPGLPAYYRVKIANTGTVADTFVLKLGGAHYQDPKVKASLIVPIRVSDGDQSGGSSSDGDTVHLFLNSGQGAMLALKVVVDRSAGEYEINVTAVSRGDPEVTAEISTCGLPTRSISWLLTDPPITG